MSIPFHILSIIDCLIEAYGPVNPQNVKYGLFNSDIEVNVLGVKFNFQACIKGAMIKQAQHKPTY